MKLIIFRVVSLMLLVFWMGCIFSLSAQTASSSSDLSHGFLETLLLKLYPAFSEMDDAAKAQFVSSLQFITRKAAHFSTYGLLGVFSFLSVISYNKIYIRLRYAISALICLLYAISDEIHQLFVPGRSGEVRDVIIDTSGALAGIMLCIVLYNLLCRIRQRRNKRIGV